MSIILSGFEVNRNHPLNRRLVSWWLNTPNVRGGIIFRDLAGQSDGTLTLMNPANDWVPTTRQGAFGALDFSGGDDYVTTGDPGQSQWTNFTLSGWIYNRDLDGDGLIVTRSNSGVGFQLYYDTVGSQSGRTHMYKWFCSSSTSSDLHLEGATDSGLLNTWQHVCGTFEGGIGSRLYIDGIEDANSPRSNTAATPEDGARSLDLGGNNPGDFLDGQLDDIRIYHRVLNASEVWQLYILSSTGYRGLLRPRREYFSVPARFVSIGGIFLKQTRVVIGG